MLTNPPRNTVVVPRFAKRGGQLADLAARLDDPLCQSVNLALIGDSITWGSGATGAADSGVRDGTLSDPRNNASSLSYANNLKNYLLARLGNGAAEVLTKHPAAASGENIATLTKSIPVYPTGDRFTATLSGAATDTHIADAAALCNYKRSFNIVSGAENKTRLAFKFSGEALEVVFGATASGAKYNLYVNGEQIGGVSYSTRGGDDGLTNGYSRARVHTFGRVTDAEVVFEVVHYDNGGGGVTRVYLEAFRIAKTVRVKNQAIIGTTAKKYRTYNLPTNREGGVNFEQPARLAGLVETPAGTTSRAERAAADAKTGTQTLYGYIAGSSWEIDVTVDPAKDKLSVAYSSAPNTGDIEIVVGGNVIDRFSTNSAAPGGSYGYGKIRTVTLPAATASVKIRSVYATYGTGGAYTNYLYLEGVANYGAADQAYPADNGFGDGVALDTADDFCMIQLGTNDRIADPTVIESPQALADELENLLDLLPMTTAPILMIAPPAALDGPPTYHAGMRDQAAVIADLAQRRALDVIDNHSIFENLPTVAYLADGLHPNNLGHRMIADNIRRALEA